MQKPQKHLKQFAEKPQYAKKRLSENCKKTGHFKSGIRYKKCPRKVLKVINKIKPRPKD
jgi:hypothetical protein